MTVPGSDRQRFIYAIGDLLASWNLSRATGRTYGQLLLESEPVSLDALAEALDLSKGAVSTSVRELVSWGLARTISQPGSRRLLVEATGGLESLLSASHDRARSFINVLRAGEHLTQEPHAQQRLHDVTDLFEGYIEAGEHMLTQHRSSRRSR